MRTDVAVIGAGLSGLTAARRLHLAGVDVRVIEAKDRVGGRTLNQYIGDGVAIDGGATYVCPVQSDVLGLAKELGVATFESYREGRRVFVYRGERSEPEVGTLPAPEETRGAVGSALERFGELAAQVSTATPWQTPDAEELDHMTLAQWRDGATSDQMARDLFDLSVSGWFAAPPERVSLLFALYYAATCGGLAEMAAAQSTILRFTDGAQALALRMAEGLDDRVHVGVPVHEIERSTDGIVVRTHGMDVEAQRIVVALAPQGCRSIRFLPGLPDARRRVIDSWEGGSLIKVNVVYDEPFWRADGFCGSASDMGAAPGYLDASPPGGVPGVLATVLLMLPEGTVRGNPPSLLADPSSRQQAVIDALVLHFGPRAAKPQAYIEKNWLQEPFTSGCESHTPPGLLTEVRGAVREPVDGIHWAGTETAERWTGWMNGAVEAGERAAAEVLREL